MIRLSFNSNTKSTSRNIADICIYYYMPRPTHYKSNPLQLLFFLDAQKPFTCPNEKRGQYQDPVQCDKYYECLDGEVFERLCPDGLVFDETIRLKNKCDQPFNVDCGDRTVLRKFLFCWKHNSSNLFRLINHTIFTAFDKKFIQYVLIPTSPINF